MSFYQLARMGNVKKFHQSLKQIAEKENRVVVVNGRQTPDEVFADVITALKSRNCL